MTDPDINPIGFLQELCQKHALRFPIYKDISASGPDHSKLFKVKCEFEEQEALGTSRRKKQAKSEAARAMIEMLKCKDFFSSLNKGSELRDRPSSCVQANFGAALNFESKNPISLIYEYCQKNAMPPAEFVETFVGGVFFCQCRLNDKNTYGNGINKKAAKTDAASKMRLELNMNCAGANYVLKELENEKNDAVSEKNPISALQEYCSQYCSTESPVYTELPPVMNLFVVQCKLGLKSSEGIGTSKKIAKAEAASKVLSDLLANGGKLENANGKTMGNNHSREGSPRYGISRNNSGVDLHDKVPSQLLPIDKLSKLLTQKTLEEDSIENGIYVGTFVRYLFPKYPELGKQLFGYWQHAAGTSSSPVLSTPMFKAQVDKLMTVMTDEKQVQLYVTMYAENAEYMNTDQFHSLLLTVYKISMDHYPDGPQSCRQLFKTLQAITNSAFHKKDSLPVLYLAHWLEEHCKRLVTVLHRYVVHILTTGFHNVTERLDDKDQGLELTTPVLEKAPAPWDKPQPLLPVSQVWVLACTLPPLYTKPQHHSPGTTSNNGFCSKNYLARVLDLSCPSHWTMLYNSLQHGLGANRFLHHVLSYRGPTLTFLRGEQDTEFCIGATHEWQESHLYWGGDESIIVQILPLYHVVQRGPKLLYLNTKIRGYPKGIRAGLDPRKPSIDINESFTYVTYKGIPYQLQSIEVWGCGTPQSREMQLDIKKWEVKQAERQRVVKLSATEWTDHPDRYLLELAGRPNYSQSNN